MKKNKKKITQSSAAWLNRRAGDIFTKLNIKNNFRSRAAYKLNDIDQKFKIVTKSSNILDLGSAPGSWLQYISRNKSNKIIVGVDLKQIKIIKNIKIIQGNFMSNDIWDKINRALLKNKFNLICSDMAPNTCGISQINHLNIINAAESVLLFATNFLDIQGNLIIKLFEGNRTKSLFLKLKHHFKEVHLFKPKASYKNSSEIFLIALNKN